MLSILSFNNSLEPLILCRGGFYIQVVGVAQGSLAKGYASIGLAFEAQKAKIMQLHAFAQLLGNLSDLFSMQGSSEYAIAQWYAKPYCSTAL